MKKFVDEKKNENYLLDTEGLQRALEGDKRDTGFELKEVTLLGMDLFFRNKNGRIVSQRYNMLLSEFSALIILVF